MQSKLKSCSNIPDIWSRTLKLSLNMQKVILTRIKCFFTTSAVSLPLNLIKIMYLLLKYYETVLTDMNITEGQIAKILKKLKVIKSTGPDSVYPHVINEVVGTLAVPLETIYNASIRTRTLPLDWKHVNFSMIFKKGSKTLQKTTNRLAMPVFCVKHLRV